MTQDLFSKRSIKPTYLKHTQIDGRGDNGILNGIRKTGPKENWSSVKTALWKLVLLQNVPGKFIRTCSDRLFWQNNDQCRRFIAAVDSKPMSLSWMRWQSHADIADDQPISLTIFILLINSRIGHEGQQSPNDCVNLKYTVIFLWSSAQSTITRHFLPLN